MSDKDREILTFPQFKEFASKLGYTPNDSELERDYRSGRAISEVMDELGRALDQYPSMASFHEGWGVIWEEVDELWDYVRESKGKVGNTVEMRKEAMQVAVTAIRFMADLCHDEGKN